MNIYINYLQYICGCTKTVQYIHKDTVDIVVPAFFQGSKIVLDDHGLLGGDLIVYVHIQNIQESEWLFLKEKDQLRMIKCLKKMRLVL
jgi:DnaJ-class molecular chaperone